jgi:hypothetical protein
MKIISAPSHAPSSVSPPVSSGGDFASLTRRLTLGPGDVATADVTAYAIDTSTGNACPRWGNLVVTPPNDFVSHPLSVDVPICSATVSSVD